MEIWVGTNTMNDENKANQAKKDRYESKQYCLIKVVRPLKEFWVRINRDSWQKTAVEDENKPVKLKAVMKGTNHLHQVKNLTHTQVIGKKKMMRFRLP